jgi:hypothetical protein
MRKSVLVLLGLLCLVICSPMVQAGVIGQTVPFAPPSNVTGAYVYFQGHDFWQVTTNFPINSQDVVFPEWLFGTLVVFMFATICAALVFVARDPAPWVNVIICGMILFGLGLSAGAMTPLVGRTEVFYQVVPLVGNNGAIPLNSTNTIYVNEVIVYSLGPWVAWACYGIAIGGFILAIAGLLLQMKAARKIANDVQQEKIMGGEIDFRVRERRTR